MGRTWYRWEELMHMDPVSAPPRPASAARQLAQPPWASVSLLVKSALKAFKGV